MSTSASPPVIVARTGTLEGSYRLERRLGAGGMGEVWLGRHVVSHGVAAVKMLTAKLAGKADAISLFAREQDAIVRLAHPHVVPVFEVGASHIAMAYIQGASLARRIRTGISPALAFRVVRQIASALAHAHARGVLHLDVKPANVLLDGADNAYLADFGTAFFFEEAELAASPTAGTPAYIAPERAAGAPLGSAADQFALGRTLVAALLGTERLPAWGKEADALPATLSEDVRAVVARATALDPKSRFPDLVAFERALAACDVEGLGANVALLPPIRDEAVYAWSALVSASVNVAPEIARVDYSLDDLARARAVSPEAHQRFCERTGLRSNGFSLYGHTQSLGAPPGVGWVARARHLIVLIPGYAMAREGWAEVAVAVVRDNPDSLVVTLDHTGFGDSVFAREPASPEHLGYAPIARMALAWTELLGVDSIPTVFVGHSMSGTGLMALPDDAFGPHRGRIVLTPMFRSLALPRWRRVAKALFLRTLAFLLAWRPLYEAVLRTRFLPDFQTRALGPARRRAMFEQAKQLSVKTQTRLGEAADRLDPPQGEGLLRSYFVLGLNDPESSPAVCERAFRLLHVRPERVRWLASGYHYPHLDNLEDPAGTARNRHELVMLVDEALNEVSPGRSHSTDLAKTETLATVSSS